MARLAPRTLVLLAVTAVLAVSAALLAMPLARGRAGAGAGVYADNNASTPPFPEVVAAVARVAAAHYANPGSIHAAGQRAKAVLDASRARAAQLLGAMPCEVVFTSGATESNNMAIRGAHRLWEAATHARAADSDGSGSSSDEVAQGERARRFRALATPLEHASVYETLRALPDAEVGTLAVDGAGRVDVAALRAALAGADVALVCVVAAHNEVGTLQDVPAIAAACRAAGARLHLDLTQLVGRYDVDLSATGAHTATCSAHKFHGPRGVGVLYVRDGVRLGACVTGGAQEMALRAGTENVPGIAGMVAALERCARLRAEGAQGRVRALRDHVLRRLLAEGPPGLRVNGHPESGGLYNTLSVCVPGIDARAVIARLNARGIYINAGCACSRGAPSHALVALGVPRALLPGTLRISFGYLNARSDGRAVADALLEALTAELTATPARGRA